MFDTNLIYHWNQRLCNIKAESIDNQLLVDDNENENQYDGIDDYELNTPGEWWIATHPHVVTGEIFIKA